MDRVFCTYKLEKTGDREVTYSSRTMHFWAAASLKLPTFSSRSEVLKAIAAKKRFDSSKIAVPGIDINVRM